MENKESFFWGILTLIKSILGSLPIYYFSLSKAPKKVIDMLEGIRRKFLWGGEEENRKINWVAWDIVTRPKHIDSLWVINYRSLNITLLAKWWWLLKIEGYNLWSSGIKALHNVVCIDEKSFVKCGILGMWLSVYQINKGLVEGDLSLEDLFFWKMGVGHNTLFWKKNGVKILC